MERSDTHVSDARALVTRHVERPPGCDPEPAATLDCSLASEPREAFRCPARQPERLQSKPAIHDCNERDRVFPARSSFQTVHSKSRLCPGPSATLNAERDERKPATPAAPFPAPIFSNCAVGQAGGVTARPVRLCARKIRAHCAIIKRSAAGSWGFPAAEAARCFPSGQFYVAQCVLSERTNFSLSVSGRALPRTGRDGATLAAPRSTSSFARIRSGVFERERTKVSGQRQRSSLFCR